MPNQTAPVPARDCDPGVRPETRLQGQVPRVDQMSGRSKQGYRCNLKLVGQNPIADGDGTPRGGNFQMTWYRDCAYVGMAGQTLHTPASPDETDHPLRGVAVVDVSTPRRPKVVQILQSPVGQMAGEGMAVNRRRGMLSVLIGGAFAQWIDIYKVPKRNCTMPRFVARYDSGQAQYHGLAISRDGKTIYATNTIAESPDLPGRKALHVIDVSDMARPRLITRWDPSDEALVSTAFEEYGIHHLELNAAGTRAYMGVLAHTGLTRVRTPSLVILDTSDLQKRVPNPQIHVISELETVNFGHTITRARVAGRAYLFMGGEMPFAGPEFCPWGWGHIIDVSDERNPTVVSDIKLEVNEVSSCPVTGPDDANYSSHWNGVDSRKRASLLAHSWYSSGLRVFDVRDPTHPREIAYYNPLPQAETVFTPIGGPTDPHPADPNFPVPPGRSFNTQTPEWDSTTSMIRVRRNGEIWFVSVGNGFQVVKLTKSAWPSNLRHARER